VQVEVEVVGQLLVRNTGTHLKLKCTDPGFVVEASDVP